MVMPLDDALAAEDDALVARFALGDGAAARVLTDRHAPRVLALARRMLRDEAEAEDVAQDAMMRLWRGAADWRAGEARLSTWLHRVAANLCIDRMRRRRRMSTDAPPDLADEAPSVLALLVGADRRAALRAALGDLPERQREALILRHFAELPNPEIAARMGLSIAAVESLTARARRSLARALAPQRDALGLQDLGIDE